MAIIGFNFTEIHAERKNPPKGKISIDNNISIKGVKKTEMPIKSDKQEGLTISFVFTADYKPDIGKIELKGDIVLIEEKKSAQSILNEWKKKKKLPETLSAVVFNNILSRASIEGIIIGRDIGLPPLLKIPRIQPSEK